jgi:hypothetical protein
MTRRAPVLPASMLGPGSQPRPRGSPGIRDPYYQSLIPQREARAHTAAPTNGCGAVAARIQPQPKGEPTMRFLRTILLTALAALALPALAQAQATSDMEILRQKVKADKKLLVAQNMQLTDAEAKGFWPVYDAYQNDLQKFNQRVGKAIAEYADAYNKGSVPNETAKKLLNETLAIEEAELKLKRAYVPKLEKALPAAKVARYVQIENKIRAAIRYELADAIPLVQ